MDFHPDSVMLVPSGACPAACRYCFGPRDGNTMPSSVLEASACFISDGLWRGRRAGKIIFHGGEPLMAGYEWFVRALGVLSDATRRHARFAVQSNLWLLDQRFVDLFAEYRVAVSTSIDGSREICDSQRGAGYFDKTMAGIRLLLENGMDVSAIATVMPENADRIPEIISFFDAEGLPFTMRGAEPSLEHGYVNYLPERGVERLYTAVLDYMEQHPAPSRIRDVEAAVRNVFSQCSGLCKFSNCLGSYAAISPTGDVYTCQRFSGDTAFRLGTVYDSVAALHNSEAYRRIAAMHAKASQSCSPCRHFKYCNGGCLYNAFVAEKYGKPWPHCNDAEPSGRVYRNLFDRVAQKLAVEAADVMLGGNRSTPYLSSAGDRLHPGDVARGRERYARALQWGATGAPRHAFAKKRGADKLLLRITGNCQLRCTRCSADTTDGIMNVSDGIMNVSRCIANASGGKSDMPLETALAVIREAATMGFDELSIYGGEPFMYRQFRELVSEMSEMRDANMAFMLMTNLCTEIDDSLAASVLQAFDRISIGLSIGLDGGEDEHDRRRASGAFARTCRHAERLAAINSRLGNPCALSLRASLSQGQKERGVADKVREVAKTLGVASVIITDILPADQPLTPEIAPSAPSTPSTPQALNKPTDLARYFASFIPRGDTRDTRCLCCNPHITPEGDIYPCRACMEELQAPGNVRDGLNAVLQDYLRGSRKYACCVDNSDKCRHCDVRYVCGGVCRAYRSSDCDALRACYLDVKLYTTI